MARELGPMSGFRDLLAEQMLPRNEVLGTIQAVYELYGFVPLKTPALERHATLTGKYGEESEGLIYAFEDHGGRDVALRYDQTVPLARVVAQHDSVLPNPYKRYALGDVWRGESPQAGRYREFTQFDADIVGTDNPLADTEVIAMMSHAMDAIGVNALVRVNDRKLLDGLAQECGVSDDGDFQQLVGTVDKVEKIGVEAALEKIHDQLGATATPIVEAYLDATGSNDEKLDSIADILGNEVAQDAIAGLRGVLGRLAYAGYTESEVVFDPTIARGLSYYTGTIFETSLIDLPGIGSVCSGGRYDNLIEELGGPHKPAVGTSIGVDRLLEGMRQLEILPEMHTRTKLYLANVPSEPGEEGLDEERFALVQNLRRQGVATEMIYDGSKVGKQIKSIDKLGVPKVVFLGRAEVQKGTALVKDLATGEQTEVSVDELANEG